MKDESFKNLKVATYARKSQESEDKQALSIPAQLDEAGRLAQQYDFTIFDSYEEAKSAKEPGQRPKFKQMVSDLRSGKINAIICWKLDRLARNMVEGGEIIDLLQKKIIKAIITPQKIHLPDENALLLAVEFGSANQYSRDLSVNVKRGQRKKAENGYPHGLAALGFRNDKTEEKGNRKWLVDEERFGLVKELFDLYLSGTWSVNKLARYAQNVMKLTTPKHKRYGGRIVTVSRVYEVLKDPIYAGIFYQEGIRYELHRSLPRIVTEAQHEKILRMIAGKGHTKVQTHQGTYTGFIKSPEGDFIGQDMKHQLICDCKHKFSFQGKTHCPKCGKEIADLECPKHLHYEYYYNVKRKKSGEKAKAIEERKITKYLVEYAEKNLHISSALSDWSKKYLYELKDKEIETNRTITQSNDVFREKLETKKKNLRNLLAEEQITPDEYKADVDEINKQLNSTMEKEKAEWFSEACELADLAVEYIEIIKADDVKRKRRVLSRLGSNLIWNEEKLSIINKKAVQVFVDGLIEAKTKNPQFEPGNIIDTSVRNEVFRDVFPIMLPR